MTNLSILPAGTLKGNAGQLICSETMQQVLQDLRERFQFVVIDSAPILPFVDGRALSTLADAVILVGRSGITTRQAMRRSVELLSEIHGAPILQVVLNAASELHRLQALRVCLRRRVRGPLTPNLHPAATFSTEREDVTPAT